MAPKRANASAESAGEAKKTKLWAGRFTGSVDPVMEAFNSSIDVDKVLWKVDLEGSRGYSHALERAEVLSKEEGTTIRAGLDKVALEWKAGSFELKASDEDVHMANERRLTELVGSAGAKIHTGRSRNDQVATDVRLWLREEGAAQLELLCNLLQGATERARAEVDSLMPGYTHLQRAQPIRWSHWILNHAASWQRDAERLQEALARANQMPLGAGALAGNPFRIDREALAMDLGFAKPCPNSLDAVTDRDFIIEFCSWATILMVHLSKFAEDLIVFGTAEFGFVSFADAYSTGSSLMPQKKNPDALELLRGKAARVIGGHNTLLCMMKGLPTAYNKDMQEDKRALFDTAATTRAALQIAAGVLATLTVHPDNMRAALSAPLLATDLSDYLVMRGMPFREAHHVVGSAVKMAEDKNCELPELSLEDYRSLSKLFDKDVNEVWDFEKAVERRDATGGTSKRAVLEQADKIEAFAQQCANEKTGGPRRCI